jgi:LPXTG-site transpeptidase (sortase) family protein
MRYRRQRVSPLSFIARMVLFGILVGTAYYLYDNWQPAAVTTTAPTALPSAIPPTVVPTQPPPTATAVEATTMLFIPTAGVRAPIIEAYLDGTSWDVTQLGANAGHLQGTGWFDQPGNIVLAGHVEMADGRAGIFTRLDELNEGDPIILTHADNERRYSVTELLTVANDDLSVLYPTTTDQLTLITCGDYDFVEDFYRERVVVIAERIR